MIAKQGLRMVTALAAMFVIGRCSVSLDHRHDDYGSEENLVSQAQEYTCAMHPQVRSMNSRDTCPLCGMALIPVPRDEDDVDNREAPRLRVNDRAAVLMEIQTTPVQRGVVTRPIRLFGQVEFDETHWVDLVLRSEGYVERLHANYVWQRLQAGDVVAEIYSPAVASALREWQVVHGQGGPAEAAARARLARLGLDAATIADLNPVGDLPRTYPVRAPRDGVVMELDQREGQWAPEGARLLRMADPRKLWINLQAFETDIAWLQAGQSVAFTVQALPGIRLEGVIDHLDPVVHDATRAARVLVRLEDANPLLKSGMLVTAQVETETAETELWIPASAPLITGQRALVYVRITSPEGRPVFEPREVVLGPRAGDLYIIESGLKEGDLVVVNGQFKIDSELQIRGQPSMMAPAGGGRPANHHAQGGDSLHVDNEPTKRGGIDLPDAFAQPLGLLVELNYKLADALADDDPGAARSAAEKVAHHLAGMHAHADPSWDEWSRVMQNALAPIRTTDDLRVQREHFESFSNTLIQAVRKYGTGLMAPVMLAVCPMVHGRDGFWLQPDKDIRNPYHGAAMYSCGYIRDVHEDHNHE